MDFFAHQEQARKRTSRLVVFYGLAVAGIIAALYFALAIVLMVANDDPEQIVSLWQPEMLGVVSLSVLSVVLVGSWIKTMQLAKGGSVVAESLGGRLLSPATHDADERRLLNVVEEMALAAGIAVPQVYLLDEERGINAFAAGFTPRDAAIGVTRGGLEQLSRDELQGVIAHEFSHIVNGDMRLNIRLMGILFGILLLTVIGRVLLRLAFSGGRRSRSSKRDGIEYLFGAAGLALFIVGYIGVFFANLIKSAISRQREFLSDAAAVQYTRNPSGIHGALMRIGGLSLGARVSNPHADEASHLFFGQVGHVGFMASLFATHPPLKERIQRLDPAFNPDVVRLAGSVPVARAARTAGVSSFAGDHAGGANMGAATQAIGGIPAALLDLAHDAAGARSVIYGLLRSAEAPFQPQQMQAVADGDPESAALLNVWGHRIASLPRALRIPLATLAVPALRTMQPAQYQTFRRLVKALTEADQQIDLFEFAISHMILRHVESAFARIDKAPVRYHRLEDVQGACSTVLAGMAAWGMPNLTTACYQAGMEVLGTVDATPVASVTLADIAAALNMLAAAAPPIKRRFINACMACILADGSVEVEQGELLRAVADAIDVPMPPMAAAA